MGLKLWGKNINNLLLYSSITTGNMYTDQQYYNLRVSSKQLSLF